MRDFTNLVEVAYDGKLSRAWREFGCVFVLFGKKGKEGVEKREG